MERVTEASVRRQRTIQTSLLLIILATLPCYCVGFVLLGVAPQHSPTTPTPPGSQVATTTESAANPTETLFPTITLYAPQSPLPPLVATPTQLYLYPTAPFVTLTFTPYIPPTITPFIPTITPIVIKTLTPTPIVVKTATPIPPSNTPLPPTATKTPVPPTATSIPTNTPLPPSATPTNTQAPTFTPMPTAT
ncbi:MAG TPA: hypothetical protein VKQ72_02715 [Aggregatilineales bacterium]|nr:hypothetical protein [Aggregatilineales bacterium]